MLNISLLPEDILLLVLKYADTQAAKFLSNWCTRLQVIAVCRQWRRMAIHMVYSDIFITCTITHREIFDTYGRMLGKQPIHSWQSNIELALENKCHQFIKSIHIWQMKTFNQLTFMRHLLKILQIGTIDWKGINKLSIRLYGEDAVDINDLDDDDEQEAMDIAQALAQGVPNVSKYKPSCFGIIGLANIFLTKLTDCYSKQLVLFDGGYIFPNCIEAPSNHITYLRLEYMDDIDIEYNCVCSLPLQNLVLIDVPYTFMWNYFHDKSDQKELVFRDLKSLSITYYRGTVMEQVPLNFVMSEQPRKLVFPKLQHLEVNKIPKNCPVIFHAQFPPTLDSIALSCSNANAGILSTVKLPKTNSATLYLHSFNNDDNAVCMQRANQLLRSIDAKFHFKLKYIVPIIQDLSNAKWDMVTQLKIANVIDFRYLLALLAKIPNVKELHIVASLYNFQGVSSILAQNNDSSTQLQLLQLKLTYLEIECLPNHIIQTFVPLLRLVFTLVPSLHTAKVNNGKTTRSLISKYSDVCLGFLFKTHC